MNEPVEVQPRPISYAIPLSRPIVTWILLALILAVFIAETLAGGSTTASVLVRMGAKVTPLIADGQYWRLFTAMFLHIGAMHLFFNGYALFAVGTELERLFGSGRFLAIYLLSGLLGSLASYAFSVKLSAGASGAIFGLIGALAAFFALYRERLGAWGRRRLANIAFLIAINLFLGFTQPGIDNLAHIGGLLSGAALGWALAPRFRFDPMHLRLADTNRLGRYWPALVLAVGVLVGGAALGTRAYQGSAHSHLYRAQQAIEQEAWDQVVSELEQALAQDPALADASTNFQLGLGYNYLEQPQKAAAAYEAVLARQPAHSASLWNLALTYIQLERYAEARSAFQTYLEINPGEAEQVQPYLDELERLE